ncbi:MAG: cysteine dioxygenase [Gammaproteobacteria bacterium]|nr:MAG: cysteine dioxygenase [Gammaproteobacteria bacterium]
MNTQRLPAFLDAFTELVTHTSEEQGILAEGATLLHALVAHDDWLPPSYSQSSPDGYRQYLLFADPDSRFVVVSFIWQPGQFTPVHDHTVWGLVGLLRGIERNEPFHRDPGGKLHSRGHSVLQPGDVVAVSPRIGDLHRVANTGDQDAISIHVYGGDIGRIERHSFDPASGRAKSFVSGYSQVPTG